MVSNKRRATCRRKIVYVRTLRCYGTQSSITKLTATRRKLRGLKDLSTGSVTPAAIAFPPILIALRFNASFALLPFVEDDLAATSSDSDRVKDGWGCDGKR